MVNFCCNDFVNSKLLCSINEKNPFSLNLWLRWKFSAINLGSQSLSWRLKKYGLGRRLRWSVIHWSYLYLTKEVFITKIWPWEAILARDKSFWYLVVDFSQKTILQQACHCSITFELKLLCMKKSDVFKSCQNLSCITDSKVYSNVIEC